MFIAYQDSLSLLGIGIFDGGEFRVWIFLFFYSVWRIKVKCLESCLDKCMANTMHRCMHNFHL